MKKTYWEKLKDPRWQRMRLAVMQRDGFACQMCSDDKSTLNVHHRIYRKGADPWDYVPDELMTLCEACHEQEHNIADKLKEILCIASSNQVPTGWIAALLLGFIETHVRNDETFDPGVIDKYWEVAEEYPSAYLAGQEARDRLMAIAVEMGQMSRG